MARIDDAATAAGRDPTLIRRIVNLDGVITDGELGDGPLVGPPALWVDTLTTWANTFRIDGFVFWPADGGTAQVERFGTEVVPALRLALAAGRG